MDRLLALWHLHRRGLLISGTVIGALLIALLATALLARSTGGRATAGATHRTSSTLSAAPTGSVVSVVAAPSSPSNDAASWNAIKPVTPATSAAYPAIPAALRHDPTSYARAFATELFNRNYAEPRSQLLAWAQYEDAPLRAPNLPRQDWSKVLVDSLTDLTWDQALDTPVPADGMWLALRSQDTTDTVSDLRVTPDPQWEQQIAHGYQPPDPLATARDISLTVTRHATIAGRATSTKYAVSLALQLGSSPHGGYGVAATNNYVIKEIG